MDETTTPQGEVTAPRAIPKLEYAEGAEEIADVSVDLEWFAEFMRQRGVTEEEISATTFLITADFLQEEQEFHLGGYYDAPTKTVAIDIAAKYWLLVMDPSQSLLNEHGNSHPPEMIDEVASDMLSEDAIHETVHRIQDSEGKHVTQLVDYYSGLTPPGFMYRVIKRLAGKNPDAKVQKSLDEIRQEKALNAYQKRSYDQYRDAPYEEEAERIAEEEARILRESGNFPLKVRFKHHQQPLDYSPSHE